MEYKDLQRIAKETISYIKAIIKPNMNLLDVRQLCEEKMLSLGADSFWYWDVGAFDYFTFEPHISNPNSKYGYKKENIYYFSNGRLAEL